MTVENKDTYDTLGIKTIPFVHVYHPQTGLAEERSLSRRNYPNFEKVVTSYAHGSCDLDVEIDDDRYALNPWDVKVKSKARAVSL